MLEMVDRIGCYINKGEIKILRFPLDFESFLFQYINNGLLSMKAHRTINNQSIVNV